MGKIMHERMLKLFDALVAAPDGLDIYQIGDLFGWDVTDGLGAGRTKAFEVIRALRLAIVEMDDEQFGNYSVPIRREGTHYIYFLSANIEQGEQWQGVRADTMLARLAVDTAHWRAMAAATDGRTHDGRIARACLRHFTRLNEDLADIRGQLHQEVLFNVNGKTA